MAAPENKIDVLLTRGVANVYPSVEFLRKKLRGKDKLTLYLGIDPTGPTLHLGHAINLLKLAEFQELGHKIILLIGSFTAMIGDPTDKLAARKPLTREQVLANCEKYKEQASRVLRFDGENAVEIHYNHEWWDDMKWKDAIGLASYFTVQQLLARDMFENRIKEGKPIGLHEFLYPLMQAYDSVAMDVDGEIGGNDQTFNMLCGRDLLKAMKNKEKFVLTNKLLTDAEGKKMGKTEGNMARLDEAPEKMFGVIMSWTDEMIPGGFELCTREPQSKLREVEKHLAAGDNPRDLKMELAAAIVKLYHGEAAARAAQENFINTFQKKELPADLPEVKAAGKNILDVLVLTGAVSSKSQGKRDIDGGGVKVNGAAVKSYEHLVAKGDVVQKGKLHYFKIK